jgi:ribosomal protein S12 methylthiotransferase
VPERYWLETLGCPKNQVDSDKLAGTLAAGGLEPADDPSRADVVVVNTCAFIEAARQESIDAVLALADGAKQGARLVVTGCMAERYGDELARALPEVDLVAPFGTPVLPSASSSPVVSPVAFLGRARANGPRPGPGAGSGDGRSPVPSFDLLELPRPPTRAPWAYVKIAEGCDRSCGFCAIPSFRGPQRSRTVDAVLAEVDGLAAGDRPLTEVVLVAQDLASFGLDRTGGGARPQRGATRPLVELVRRVADRVPWVRLLYLYPSSLDDELVDAVLATGVPYFDLSLQHVSRPLLHRMRRWGGGDRFLDRITSIRSAEPGAAFRSSFIVGYPGETEEDHDRLLAWLAEARLDWAGFFPFSPEDGTPAAGLGDRVPAELVRERIDECTELQDAVTATRRDALIGSTVEVLVDEPGRGRTYREAPEIDGVVELVGNPGDGVVAEVVRAEVVATEGSDLVAELVPCGVAR